jgi:hypothetical protein
MRACVVLTLKSARMATTSFASVRIVGNFNVMGALAHSSMLVALEIIGSTALVSSLSCRLMMVI